VVNPPAGSPALPPLPHSANLKSLTSPSQLVQGKNEEEQAEKEEEKRKEKKKKKGKKKKYNLKIRSGTSTGIERVERKLEKKKIIIICICQKR
jgi:protoporphyrinogen oxidase